MKCHCDTINTFLKNAANRTEQKFWIGRTYGYIRHYSEDEAVRLWGDLSWYRMPRNIRDVPHLGIVAKVWEFETNHNKPPTEEQILQFIQESHGRDGG